MDEEPPMEFLAVARRVCEPLAYAWLLICTDGCAGSAAVPASAESMKNCTSATPSGSAALTEAVKVPVTVAPAAGASPDSVGPSGLSGLTGPGPKKAPVLLFQRFAAGSNCDARRPVLLAPVFTIFSIAIDNS